jgi:hypothetical protein
VLGTRLTTSSWKTDDVEKPKSSQGQIKRTVVLKRRRERISVGVVLLKSV